MILRTLDRYILKSWIKIFVITALGFPLVSILINLVDFLDRWLSRGLTAKEIAISYFFSIPENAFNVMPAAVLFATVFTVGNLGRYSELTAAKAGGQSFHRLVLPILIAAVGASLLAVVVGELAPGSSKRMNQIQNPDRGRNKAAKFNFVFRAEQGWVYTIGALDLATRRLRNLVLERQGNRREYADLAIEADSAAFDSTVGTWRLWNGVSRFVGSSAREASFQFESMQLRAMTQSPSELLVEPKAPDEMRYAELGRYITALRRSGNDANKLAVEQALKLALPATCFVIALFAAPLGVTTPRAGTAVGVAIALGTTVVFLTLVQISKAVGAGGTVNPVAAAWAPNALCFVIALILMRKVRT